MNLFLPEMVMHNHSYTHVPVIGKTSCKQGPVLELVRSFVHSFIQPLRLGPGGLAVWYGTRARRRTQRSDGCSNSTWAWWEQPQGRVPCRGWGRLLAAAGGKHSPPRTQNGWRREKTLMHLEKSGRLRFDESVGTPMGERQGRGRPGKVRDERHFCSAAF